MRFHDWLLWKKEKFKNPHEVKVNFASLQWFKTKIEKNVWKIVERILNLGSKILILLVMTKPYHKLYVQYVGDYEEIKLQYKDLAAFVYH
jgi:hypothetical protein